MEARFRVLPSSEKGKYNIEINFEDRGTIHTFGKVNVSESELDQTIANFKNENGPYQMIQILPNGEERIL